VPETTVFFYKDEDDTVPVKDWLEELRHRDRKAFAQCVAVIRLLALSGHELRRPKADFLRDGIYELRAKKGRVNYRLLYFFHGKSVALLAHALTKEDVAPDADIKRAVERKKRYERNPEKHTHEESLDEQA
jgi:phage-related protein